MLIIFDLDDTLIDTTGSLTPILLKKALIEARERGLHIESFDETYQKFCHCNQRSASTEKGIENFFSQPEQKPFVPLVKKIVLEEPLDEIVEISLFPGVEKTLVELRERHILGLVTKGEESRQWEKLKKTGFDLGVFSKISVIDDDSKKKSYREMALELNFTSDHVFACGDRIIRDLLPAKELGFQTIHVKQGRGAHEVDQHQCVDFSAYDIEQIPSLIVREQISIMK